MNPPNRQHCRAPDSCGARGAGHCRGCNMAAINERVATGSLTPNVSDRGRAARAENAAVARAALALRRSTQAALAEKPAGRDAPSGPELARRLELARRMRRMNANPETWAARRAKELARLERRRTNLERLGVLVDHAVAAE